MPQDSNIEVTCGLGLLSHPLLYSAGPHPLKAEAWGSGWSGPIPPRRSVVRGPRDLRMTLGKMKARVASFLMPTAGKSREN